MPIYYINGILLLLILYVPSIQAGIIFPPLKGPYPVGTRRIEVVDYDRKDPYAPGSQPRAPMLQLWYPISSTALLTPAPWLPPNSSYYEAQDLGIPVEELESIKTGTFINGTAIFPLARKEKGSDQKNSTVPILVFSPGSGALCAIYSIFLSSLASFGYTIVGIDHPYDSDHIERPSGEVIFRNETQYFSNITLAVETRRDDVLWLGTQLTPDKLTNLLSTPPSTLHSTTLSLGIFGQSLGGTTANMAMVDTSTPFQSSASLDSPFLYPLNETGFHGPLLYMGGTINPCCHESLLHCWHLITSWKLAVAIRGTTHFSFSDFITIRLQLDHGVGDLPDVGEMNPERMVELVTDYLRAFWEWTLEGGRISGLLRGKVDAFPEVDWEDLDGNGGVMRVLSDSWRGLKKQTLGWIG